MSSHNYTILKKIGEGGQGKTFLAVNEHGEYCCIKKVTLPALSEKRGAFLKQRLTHPAIIQTIDSYEDERYFYHVMPYVFGKSLGSYYHQLTMRQTRQVGKQLLEIALDFYLHHLSYNDMKPDNVLVNEKFQVSLIDYGSVLEIDDQTTVRYGNPEFCSPEFKSGALLDETSDIYGISRVLDYCCGRPNFLFRRWLKKAGAKDRKDRYSHWQACFRAFCFKLRYFIIVSFLLIGSFFLAPYLEKKSDILLKTSEGRCLFHVMDLYDTLDEIQAKQLSNDLLAIQDDFSWLMQEKLLMLDYPCFKSRHLLLTTNQLEDLNLQEEDVYFYMQYLIYKQDITHLNQLFDELIKETTLIQIQVDLAFYLNQQEFLKAQLTNLYLQPSLKALCCYYLFSLGNYQEGYLHQGLSYLDGQTNLFLYNEIQQLILQWGKNA